MADDTIGADPDTVMPNIVRLNDIDAPIKDFDEGSFPLWKKAGLPDEFRVQAGRTIREVVEIMDETIELALVISAHMKARLRKVGIIEDEITYKLKEMIIDMVNYRNVVADGSDISQREIPRDGPQP